MKEKPSTENAQKCCSGLELAVREQTLRICPLGIDHAERTFYNLLEFSVVSLDSVYEIRTTRACSLYTPDAWDTISLRSAPPAPVVRGWRPAVRASQSRNTLPRCASWQQVIRFPKPHRSEGL